MTKRFEKAESDKVEELGPFIDHILFIMGHPEALVTDESKIWDFTCFEPEKVKEISKDLGFEVKQSDYLIDIARRLSLSDH